MSIEIRELKNKKELKAFVKFHWKLYKGVAQFVPPMMDFEMSTLSSDKNPAFKHSQGRFWMAFKDEKPVGRIAGIVHGEESKKEKKIRFGWVDFIDDYEVSKALFDTVEKWGKSEKLELIHGPLGFTDLDFEGILVNGFNQISTQATTYNFPYYQAHFEHHGFQKAVDWTETRIKVPEGIGDKLNRSAKLIESRYGFKLKSFKSGKEIKQYGNQVFDLLNEAYSHLYGYYELTDEQVEYYIESYFGFVKKDLVAMVVDSEDKVIGFAITFPSLSKAFQKAKGQLFPFGFIHVLKAFFFNDTIDFFLIAAKKEHQKKGVHALLWSSLYAAMMKHDIKYVFSGQMIEDNNKVHNLLSDYESSMDEEIRRRCYTKKL
ncbi:MAG: N-acetyltransferase [Cyclobacteriaceae bacterium]